MGNEPEYRLTMTSAQAKEVRKAVELLMRLKLGQYEELPFALCDLGADDFCERRDNAKPYLAIAFDHMGKGGVPTKDDEWYRLYDLYQVIRYAIHEAEYPDSVGVDSYKPMKLGGGDEPMPIAEIKEAGAWRLP